MATITLNRIPDALAALKNEISPSRCTTRAR